MLELKYTATFKKSYKRCIKRGLDVSLIDEVIKTIQAGDILEDKYKR